MTDSKPLPDRTGRVELLCPHCGLYLLLPRGETPQSAEMDECPYCGTGLHVRWPEPPQ